MVVDFHVHIFPPKVRKDREKYFLKEPDFKLLYDSPGSRLAGTAELIEAMDKSGVDLSVVSGFPWKNIDLAFRHNDYLMEAVAKHPDRLRGLACFDPLSRFAFEEAERCLKGGLSGVGELAFYQSLINEEAIESLRPIMELCRLKNAPALFHANEPIGHSYPGKSPAPPSCFYELAKQFPHNKIILAHWGGGLFFYHLLKKEAKRVFKNMYFDTAASPFLYDSAIYSLASRIVGAGKIIFGSDYPLINVDVYLKEMLGAGLSSKEMEMICGKNALGLLD